MTVTTDFKMLYLRDDLEWLDLTIELLKSNRLHELDIEHLIEELEDLGNERRSAVESLLEQVIRHLLICQYWAEESERNGNHWRAEIMGFRSKIERRLTPNLRNHLESQLPKIYQAALKYVQQKTGFKVNFPQECPYNLVGLLDIDWLP